MRALALILVYTPLALSLAAFDGFPSINPIRPGLPSAPSAIERARHDAPHGKLSGWQHIYHGAHQSAPNASPRVGGVDFTPNGSEQASGGPGHRATAIGCAHAPGWQSFYALATRAASAEGPDLLQSLILGPSSAKYHSGALWQVASPKNVFGIFLQSYSSTAWSYRSLSDLSPYSMLVLGALLLCWLIRDYISRAKSEHFHHLLEAICGGILRDLRHVTKVLLLATIRARAMPNQPPAVCTFDKPEPHRWRRRYPLRQSVTTNYTVAMAPPTPFGPPTIISGPIRQPMQCHANRMTPPNATTFTAAAPGVVQTVPVQSGLAETPNCTEGAFTTPLGAVLMLMLTAISLLSSTKHSRPTARMAAIASCMLWILTYKPTDVTAMLLTVPLTIHALHALSSALHAAGWTLLALEEWTYEIGESACRSMVELCCPQPPAPSAAQPVYGCGRIYADASTHEACIDANAMMQGEIDEMRPKPVVVRLSDDPDGEAEEALDHLKTAYWYQKWLRCDNSSCCCIGESHRKGLTSQCMLGQNASRSLGGTCSECNDESASQSSGSTPPPLAPPSADDDGTTATTMWYWGPDEWEVMCAECGAPLDDCVCPMIDYDPFLHYYHLLHDPFLTWDLGYRLCDKLACTVTLLAVYSTLTVATTAVLILVAILRVSLALITACAAIVELALAMVSNPTYILVVAFEMIHALGLPSGIGPLAVIAMLPLAAATDDDQTGGGSRPPSFSGDRMGYTPWLIMFVAWVAYKLADSLPLLDDPPQDRPADLVVGDPPPTPEEFEQRAREQREWDRANRRLYGAVILAVPAWLATSIHMAHRGDGRAALDYLRTQFDAQDRNDVAASIARVQGCYIDSRADINEADLRHQADAMLVGNAAIARAGGTAFPAALLIAMFDNSLPESYSIIRQQVRRAAHATFDAHFSDYQASVRAELESRRRSEPHAMMAPFIPGPPNDDGGRGRGRGGGGGGRGGAGGRGRGKGKGGGRGDGGGRGNGYGQGSSRCTRCGSQQHMQNACTQPPTRCPHCINHADHHVNFCPHNPNTHAWRNEMSNGHRRSVDWAAGASPAHAAHAAHAPPPPPPAAQPSQGTAMMAPAAPPAPPIPAESGAPLDFTALTFMMRVPAFAMPMRRPPLEVPSSLRVMCPSVAMAEIYVDSMATFTILTTFPKGFQVTNARPGFSVEAASGPVPVRAVGNVGVYLQLSTGEWRAFTLTNVLIVPEATANLYSTRAMRDAYGARHTFEPPFAVHLPNGTSVPFRDDGSAFVLTVGLGPPPKQPTPHAATITLSGNAPIPNVLSAVHAHKAIGGAGPSQALLWQRLGYPYPQQWRYVATMTEGHGQPPNSPLSATLLASDAVMTGRARAAPFFRNTLRDDTLPPPGAVLYMDYAGRLTASHPHKYIGYSGIICKGSSYGRAYPTRSFSAEVARSTLNLFLADISAKMGLSYKIKPSVIVTDQGSGYMAAHFREFLADNQMQHQPAPTYTPQSNSVIERMWGYTFGTTRVLLASARLPPNMHPFAVQTACWLHNRLPMPSRGNVSPYFVLSRLRPDVSYLRAFGCLARVHVPSAARAGDNHFADRGRAALYMGPSEVSPAAVVYYLSDGSSGTSRNLVCYEDRFPGARGGYEWPSGQGGVQEGVESNGDNSTDATSSGFTTPPPPLTTPSNGPPATPTPAVMPPSTPVATPIPPPFASPAADPSPLPTAPMELPRPMQQVTTHEAAQDPSSRHFDRHANQPQLRRNRTQTTHLNIGSTSGKAYSMMPTYSDLNSACIATAARNFALLNTCYYMQPAYVMASMVADVTATVLDPTASSMAYLVRHTAELGDVTVPKSYRHALASPHVEQWREAMAKEIKGLLERGTWSPIRRDQIPSGSNVMSCHFVFEVKRTQTGSIEKWKARLVADGNTQVEGVDYHRIFSTVVKASTIRLALALAAYYDYNLTSIDVRQAYLYADLKEELYMAVPPGLPRHDGQGNPIALKLNKSLYGLKQAGREWNELLVSFLLTWGFTQSKIDVCLFIYAVSTSILWVLVYVDDCLQVDNDPVLRKKFTSDLSARFSVEDKGELMWILGLKIERERSARRLTISQELYVSDLLSRHASDIDLARQQSRSYPTPMEPSARLGDFVVPTPGSAEYDQLAPRRHAYMAIVGGLHWLANMTRFEISFACSQLARYVSNPGLQHFDAAVRVLLYLKDAKRELVYSPRTPELNVQVDSSWEAKFSSSGGLFFFGNCLISWFSKVQRSVTFSSTEAEIFGCIIAAKEVMWLRELLVDFGLAPRAPTSMYTDNKSCVDLSFDPTAFKKTKHILRAAEGLRDATAREVIIMKYILGRLNMADLLTKAVAVHIFTELMAAFDAHTGVSA